jgi:hypothetical protein
MESTLRGSNVPSIIVAPDGSVHVRVHATTLHLSSAEFMELVARSLDALAIVTRAVRQKRAGGGGGSGDLQ